MRPALCMGTIVHRRMGAVRHAFRYPLMMTYFDLAESEAMFGVSRLWSTRRGAVARFCRADYLGEASRPLEACVREEVQKKLGFIPRGPVCMLTHPRYFGFVFNPLTLYFCYDESGARVEAVVAEVTNTPWNERHVYVWPAEVVVERLSAAGHSCRKAFHVSPFMPMEQTYRVGIVQRERGLAVRLQSWEAGACVHEATLTLRKHRVTGKALRRALVAYPAMTLQVVARIYAQALRLWVKRAPFFGHPQSAERPRELSNP